MSSKWLFTCIFGIFLPLNPSGTTVYARSAFYPESAVLILHFALSLRFTHSLQSAFYPWSAVCSPQSVFYTDWLEIQFRMASFSKMSFNYSLSLAWGVQRGLKSVKRFWPDLMTFRSSISTGKPEQLLSLMCFFFGFLKSSVWFMRLKFIHEQWSNLQ